MELTCRWFESVVRYIAIPTMTEALFSYAAQLSRELRPCSLTIPLRKLLENTRLIQHHQCPVRKSVRSWWMHLGRAGAFNAVFTV